MSDTLEVEEDEVATYEVVRFYQDLSVANEVIETGLTLEEAKEHCQDPETSSRTCTSEEGRARTSEFGEWFEGFREE